LYLSSFSLQEVKHCLADTLNVPLNKLPLNLDYTVFELSGGNPFWVKEIASYCVTYGWQEFLTNTSSANTKNVRQKNNSIIEIKNAPSKKKV
jgi:hypothetical protein